MKILWKEKAELGIALEPIRFSSSHFGPVALARGFHLMLLFHFRLEPLSVFSSNSANGYFLCLLFLFFRKLLRSEDCG